MSDLSIRVVFQTQFLENYGAHCWDGEGECPQRWKPKGGSTYIVSASAEDIAMSSWWDTVERAIEKSNDYEREYILDHKIVDAIDFVESDHIDFWESATKITVAAGGDLLVEQESLNFQNQVCGIRRWVQNSSGASFGATYQKFDPVTIEWRLQAEMGLHGPEDLVDANLFDDLEAV